MKIRFGMGLDGGCWPEFEPGQQAVIGEAVLGSVGLIRVLETALGLVADDAPEALRIRRYMERIQSLPAGSRFYSSSFDADAWATARELLQWRDTLVMHGWQADSGAPERIAALAEIEHADTQLPDGLADRFQHVVGELRNSPPLPIRQIAVEEPLALLPTPWRQMLELLTQCGVALDQAHPAAGESKTPLEEIVLLESEHLWPLAQTVAAWIAGSKDQAGTALLCQHGSEALDQALHGNGLPATGQVSKSAQLGVFQLLPLVLENLWRPVRIERLMELLSVPLSPVPGFAARALIAAIAKEPGLEGGKWRDALTQIREKKRGYLIHDGLAEDAAEQQAQAFADDLDHWLRRSRSDADAEASTATIILAIQRLIAHLAGCISKEPQAAIAMGHCRDLLRVLEGMDSISKPLLERIVDDLIGPGRAVGNLREAAPWGVIDNAAQLIAPVDTVIWWGFTDTSAPAEEVWSVQEREWLAAHGVQLDRAQLGRSRERFYWHTVLQRCRRLLLCRPLEVDGAVAPVHPFWFDIESDRTLQRSVQRQQAVDLLTENNPQLMGVALSLEAAKSRSPWPVTPIRQVAPSPDFKPEKLSPTSIGSLFGCNFKWLLETLGIRSSDMMRFPEESAMIGTLAHQVLEDVFSTGAIPDPKTAADTAAKRFAIRAPEMAAELLLPENRSEYAGMRERLAEAAADVARRFADAGFVRLACEEWISTKLDDIPVNGRADVIAYDADDNPHIIDFKYSFSSNFYRDKIKKGRDVQLITYARMLGERPRPVAYYLVPKREMLTNSSAFAVETIQSTASGDDGWQRVRKGVAAALGAIRNGEVTAAGLFSKDELKEREKACEADGGIYLDPPCRFCDFKALCGLNAKGDDDE